MLTSQSPFKWIFIALTLGLFGFGLSVLWENYNRHPDRVASRSQASIEEAQQASINAGLVCLNFIREESESASIHNTFMGMAFAASGQGTDFSPKYANDLFDLAQAESILLDRYNSESIDLEILYENHLNKHGNFSLPDKYGIIPTGPTAFRERKNSALSCPRDLP